MTPATLIREASGIAALTASQLVQAGVEQPLPAVFAFAAQQLAYAAQSIGDLDGPVVEDVFADELRVAWELVGVAEAQSSGRADS